MRQQHEQWKIISGIVLGSFQIHIHFIFIDDWELIRFSNKICHAKSEQPWYPNREPIRKRYNRSFESHLWRNKSRKVCLWKLLITQNMKCHILNRIVIDYHLQVEALLASVFERCNRETIPRLLEWRRKTTRIRIQITFQIGSSHRTIGTNCRFESVFVELISHI